MDDITRSLEILKGRLNDNESHNLKSLRIGDIIYVDLTADEGLTLNKGYSPRKKYVVIVGFTSEGVAIGALLINSKIAPIKRSPELVNCQYPLRAKCYPNILKYDSWLDCSDIFELPKEKIQKRNGQVRGHLIEEDKELVIGFLKETDVIDNITKRRFGLL